MKVSNLNPVVDNAEIARTGQSTRWLLAAGAIGLISFVLVFLIDGFTRPGYDPLRHWISHLSLGERGWLGTANLLLGGASSLLLSAGLRRVFRSGTGSLWGPLFVALFGLGLLLAAAFPIDPGLGYPPGVEPGDSPSLTGTIHDVAGLIVFGALTAACLTLARRFRGNEQWKGWWRYSLLTGILVPVAFIICSILVGLDYSGSFPGAPSGLFERISMILGSAWAALLAVRLLREVSVQAAEWQPEGGHS